MESTRFELISKMFAERRLSRRKAMSASAGAVASAATLPLVTRASTATPGASPAVEQDASDRTTFLFVQSFQSGTLTRDSGHDSHTLTLEHGLGQTIYFGDRPSREVGITPTEDFIKGFNFSSSNPPNAALIVERGTETDLAVIELFDPAYDADTHTATYQVRGLEAWDNGPQIDMHQGSIAEITPHFDGAHLLIDDCPDESVACVDNNNGNLNYKNELDDMCYAYGQCMPCVPYAHNQPNSCATWDYWKTLCDQDSNACPSGDCHPYWGQGISDWLGCT